MKGGFQIADLERHRASSMELEVGGRKSDDRRQKRAELVEEWSIMSDYGLAKNFEP